MVAFVRILLVAGLGAGGAVFGIWLLVQFSRFSGQQGISDPSWWIVAAAGALLGGLSEAKRCFVEARRRRKNAALATELGARFVGPISAMELRALPEFSVFRKDSPSGHQRVIGEYQGRPFDVFDFEYTVTSQSTEGGSSTTRYSQTVYRFPDAGRSQPRCLLQPRRLWTGVLTSLTASTEAILTAPDSATPEIQRAFTEFNKRYQITVPSDGVLAGDLQRLFHPFTVAWFSLHSGWALESNGADLVAWRPNKVAAGQDRLTHLQALSELLALISASPAAADIGQTSKIDLPANDRISGMAGIMMAWLGVMLGMVTGALAGVLALVLVVPQFAGGEPKTPVILAVFFGCGITGAVLGGLAGWRFGQSSASRNLVGRFMSNNVQTPRR